MATVFALASGTGRAGVAVVRVSGPAARSALEALTGGPAPAPRRTALRTLRDPATGERLDQGLVILFEAPESFTGETVAEFHVHGGPAVVEGVLAALSGLSSLAPAAPGDFSRRAFENGKLDLTQAEAIADLVEAETEGQRRQALRQMDGALSALYEGWRQRLIALMARLEAEIDFPDEADVPRDVAFGLKASVGALRREIRAHLDDHGRGERVREGYRVVILGPPNAGKSSLLNRLAGREAAIVSDIAGTTRDIVEARLVLGGYPVWIADTAGLREAGDRIEAEGVRRAVERAREADLRLVVIDPGDPGPPDLDMLKGEEGILVVNKIDLPASPWAERLTGSWPGPVVRIAAATGEGVAGLLEMVGAHVTRDLGAAEAPPLSRARHRHAVGEAIGALERAEAAFGRGPELAGEDLRLAARALGRITGRVDVEDILDVVFSSFCIGK